MSKKIKQNTPVMYDYYSESSILPTYANFKSENDLIEYEGRRKNIFLHKLNIPITVFKDAKLLEFGPDSGENALIFAKWGASCTLCEPNLKAHPFIKKYFHRFNLSSKLVELNNNSIAGDNSNLKSGEYNLIIAEGFIYTVKPFAIWMKLFSKLITKQGLVVVNYIDKNGGFFELLLKVIYNAVKKAKGMNTLKAATAIFDSKWKSIPHTRSFESWIMDVMENPFVRLKYFVEPHALCQQMHDLGFTLYSSLPSYKNGLVVEWVKKPWKADEAIQSQLEFITSNQLSHFFGQQCFLIQPDKELEKILKALLSNTDDLIDSFDVGKLKKCQEHLALIASALDSGKVIIPDGRSQQLRDNITSVKKIFQLIEQNNIDELITFSNSDHAFISSWGNPTHYAVFIKQ